MSKLTLSIDPAIVANAKRYAKQRGTSVSHMVETYLSAISASAEDLESGTPILQSLRGILKKGDPHDYKKHLERKYQ